MTATITIHADSTNRRNAGPGGYAAIISGTRVDNFPFQTATSGGYPQTTNQRMDLMAVIAGLNTLDEMVNAGKIGHRHTINIESTRPPHSPGHQQKLDGRMAKGKLATRE